MGGTVRPRAALGSGILLPTATHRDLSMTAQVMGEPAGSDG